VLFEILFFFIKKTPQKIALKFNHISLGLLKSLGRANNASEESPTVAFQGVAASVCY
jgi:hypothetical protein